MLHLNCGLLPKRHKVAGDMWICLLFPCKTTGQTLAIIPRVGYEESECAQNKGGTGGSKGEQLRAGNRGSGTATLDPLPLEKANKAANTSQRLAEVAGGCFVVTVGHRMFEGLRQ